MKPDTPPNPRGKTRTSAKPDQRWQGAIEGLHRGLLYGWAIDTAQPDAYVVLEICRDNEPFGCLIADVARTDLSDAFDIAASRSVANTCHGFVADLGRDFEKHAGVLTVRVANTGVLLPGHLSIDEQDKPPVSATSNVFGDGALGLHGWVIDSADEQRPVTVRAYVGHQMVAEAIANLEHPAMRSFNIGMHGFNLNLPLALADGQVHTVRVVDEQGMPLNGSPLTICCFGAGVKALLPEGDNDLLGDVIDVYERYLPRSLGMDHFANWAAMFEVPSATLAKHKAALKVGIIITGEADAGLVTRTTASLNAQTGVEVQVFALLGKGNKTRPFGSLLQLALNAHCHVIGCVRAGDTLVPHALATALEGFALSGAQLVYTDSESAGIPWFKPAWNPDYALCSDFPLELMLVRTSVLSQTAATNGLPVDQASWSWQMLAALWTKGGNAIVHVPHVLYQFQSPLSAIERNARATAAQQALAALEPTATLTLLPAFPAQAGFQPRRVARPLTKRERSKTVSLIIPTRDHVTLLERCISTIGQFTDWPNLEIIVIDNGSTEAKTKTYFRKIAKEGIKVLAMPGPFNYADLNNRAVEAASGEIVGLINNDIEALHEGWLDEIVGQLLRPGVGAVGAKLLWPNSMVQHGGVLLGVGNVAGHFGNRLSDEDWGDHGRNQLVQQVSGVTAACLFLRKKDYLAAGGMDALAFPVAFNDVDLCLKLRKQGKAIIWTPHARLLHAESASRGHEDTPQKRARAQRELDQLRKRWAPVLLRDPAYHPSLNLDTYSHAFGGLALPPRDRRPRGPALVGTDE